MQGTKLHEGPLPDPIATLEYHLVNGGVSLMQAVFENTFFAHPDEVRQKTPWFPDFVRKSRTYYPGKSKGESGVWNGISVRLDDNSRAQMAWGKYSGRPVSRGSGYGVRHVWGNPWNPAAFTAGWNLAYMPFWAGMLTEDQHPHPLVQRAIKQAAFDLYFRDNAVCDRPDFVHDPGLDLADLLQGQELLLLRAAPKPKSRPIAPPQAGFASASHIDTIRAIRSETHQSWSNLLKAVAALQDLPHAAFGTKNVESSSTSIVRRIQRETGLGISQIEVMLKTLAP